MIGYPLNENFMVTEMLKTTKQITNLKNHLEGILINLNVLNNAFRI